MFCRFKESILPQCLREDGKEIIGFEDKSRVFKVIHFPISCGRVVILLLDKISCSNEQFSKILPGICDILFPMSTNLVKCLQLCR